MRYKVSVAPATTPVTLAEAKLWLRVDGTDDNDLITGLIGAATDYCQQYEGRAYVEQTLIVYYDSLEDIMPLPVPPVLSVTSVEYRDSDDDWQTLDVAYYTLHNATDPAYVEVDISTVSLSVKDVDNSIRITFKAGYLYDDSGDWLGTIPERVKAAMCLLISHWYEHRLAACEAQLKEIPMGVKSLLSERIWVNAD